MTKGFECYSTTPSRRRRLAERLRKALPSSFEVIDWTQDHASYFRAIRIEKTMMAILLMLVVAVAAFSIVAMLVMVVTDKRTDIAILENTRRVAGQDCRRVSLAGLVIGWVGVGLGVIFGVLLAYNADPIMHWLEQTFGSSDVGLGRLLRHDPSRRTFAGRWSRESPSRRSC